VGIQLVKDAATRAPDSLTWRERYALMVLAASAMDATRECLPGIEDNPDITERLRLGRSERYAVISSLVAKGALMRLERGRNGVKAVYAIAPFATLPGIAERPGEPDASPVENPREASGKPGRFDPAKGPGSTDEGSGKLGLKGPGNPDAAPYKGSYGFKTGGKTPPPPSGSRPLPFALPDVPPEEGEFTKVKNPAANDPKRDLAAEIRKTRDDWTVRSIIRGLERAMATGREWPLAAEGMRIIAADPATQHAGRLEYDGPWWAEARRRLGIGTGQRPEWCGQCEQETRLTREDNPRRCPRCHPLRRAS
jgi:hypothetical protein